MPRSHPGETWLFTVPTASEEGIHCSPKAKEHLLQELVIDIVQLWIVLPALFERLLCYQRARPCLPIAQAHHPPIVQSSALCLHKFQGRSITSGEFKLDLFADMHVLALLPP